MSQERTSGLDAKDQLAALGQMTGELIHDLANEMTVLQAWALLARGEQEAGRSASSELERVLRIEDDGPGVPPDRREEIFRPLVRGGDGGVGLGLSSVVWATGQLGGEVSYAPGGVLGGAAFEIRVPMARRTTSPRGIAGVPAAKYLDRMRIVLIESDPSVRRSLKRRPTTWAIAPQSRSPSGHRSENPILPGPCLRRGPRLLRLA
jgi:hypothetical protein